MHWLVAVAAFALLGSGLALYLPSLADRIDRPTAKAVHLWAAAGLGLGLVLIALLGDRRGMRRTARELDRYDADDAGWLTGAPQGRFNAGQKLNAAFSGGLLVVLAVTGLLLYLGERDTRLRFDGTVIVHDWATWLLCLLLVGHLYLALLHPATRHALRGMTTGEVDRSWAQRHHPRWVEEVSGSRSGSPPSPPVRVPPPGPDTSRSGP